MDNKHGNRRSAVPEIYPLIEEGRALKFIGIFLAAVLAIAFRVSGGEPSTVRIRIDESQVREIFHSKKVSQIPRELEKQEAEKAVADEKVSPEMIRDRYMAYVMSRIESRKVYPEEEQKKGREGSVVLRLIISRDGSVSKVTVLRPARYQALTEAAVQSVRRSLPIQAFPAGMVEDQLSITLEILFELK